MYCRVRASGSEDTPALQYQVLKLDADRETTLKLGDQVARLAQVKCPGRHEQDVVRLHGAVPRVDRGAFDDGQDVPLDALPGDVRPATPASAVRAAYGDLVDLVDEDDSICSTCRRASL